MSNKVIERNNCSRSPFPRAKSPIYLSPKTKLKQPAVQAMHIPVCTPNPIASLNPNESSSESVLKNLQPHPLQFSASRKLKSKHPLPCHGIININSSPYPFNLGGLGNENANVKANNNNGNNQNRNADLGRFQAVEVQKMKNYYEAEIRALVEGFKGMQGELENRFKAIEKERNYWKDCYATVKQQYETLAKLNQHKKVQKAAQPLPAIPNLQQLLSNLDKSSKSLKVAENQIYTLNKQKAELSYQLAFYREESRKATAQIFQLQYQIEIQRRELKELREKVNGRKENQSGLIKSMDGIGGTGHDLTMSLEHPSEGQAEGETPRRSSSSSKSRSSSSMSLSSSSSSGKHRSSRHHRSSSHNSHHHKQIPQPHPELLPFQLNYDLNKEIQRFRHSCRKLEKCLVNQNSEIMVEGIRALNSKYKKLYQQEESQQTPVKEPIQFKFPCMHVESKGKITSIKYI